MTIQLEEYNKKRNFGITVEPEGGAHERAAAPDDSDLSFSIT